MHLDITATFLPPAGALDGRGHSPGDATGSDAAGDDARDAPGHEGGAAADSGARNKSGGGGAAASTPRAGGCPRWAAAAEGVAGPAAGLILKSWRPGGQGAAVVLFDWVTARLEVHFDEARAGVVASGGAFIAQGQGFVGRAGDGRTLAKPPVISHDTYKLLLHPSTQQGLIIRSCPAL
jgi:hypothetical protein